MLTWYLLNKMGQCSRGFHTSRAWRAMESAATSQVPPNIEMIPNLTGANLGKADLIEANLARSRVTPEQLVRVWSLEGAILPDGTKRD